MKYIVVAVAVFFLALTLGRTEMKKEGVVVHQTKSGKFIQVGNAYYSSGIAARPPDGSVPQGMAAQTRATLQKLQQACTEMGLKMSDVVKVTVYITDEKLKPEMNAEYEKTFSGPGSPCRTAVSVAGLDPGRVVEMGMIAVKH